VATHNLAKCEVVMCRLAKYEVAVYYLLKCVVATHSLAKCGVVMCRLAKYEVTVLFGEVCSGNTQSGEV